MKKEEEKNTVKPSVVKINGKIYREVDINDLSKEELISLVNQPTTTSITSASSFPFENVCVYLSE